TAMVSVYLMLLQDSIAVPLRHSTWGSLGGTKGSGLLASRSVTSAGLIILATTAMDWQIKASPTVPVMLNSMPQPLGRSNRAVTWPLASRARSETKASPQVVE